MRIKKVIFITILGFVVLNFGIGIITNLSTKVDTSKVESLEIVNVIGDFDSKSAQESNYIIMLSNQSFRKPKMRMKVYIDEIEILNKKCKVENQHKVYYYYFNIVGEHEIKIESEDGEEVIREINFEDGKSIWSKIMYWNYEEEGPRITHNVQDTPFIWMGIPPRTIRHLTAYFQFKEKAV